MADITYDEFQLRVARKLGIVAQTQSLSAEDAELIQLAAQSVNAQMAESGLAFDVTNGVAHQFVDAFTELTMAELADEFQVPEPRRSMLKGNGWGLPGRSPAERRIRRYFDAPKPQVTADITYV